jgi:predicted small lipoprotein YifL
MPGGDTVYVRVGNLFAYLCIAATLLLLAIAARRGPLFNPMADFPR